MNSEFDNQSAVAQFLEEFEATADISYRQFLAERVKATSQPNTIIGIRMGTVRRYGRMLAKHLDYFQTMDVLYPKAQEWYEYKLLFGLVVQRVTPKDKVLEVLPILYDLCDGWAVPDLYLSVLGQFAKKGSLAEVLSSIQIQTKSPNPFARRLSVVVQMDLVKQKLVAIEEALEQCVRLQWDDEYLVQMGVAWTLSDLYVLQPEMVGDFLEQKRITSEGVLKKYQQKLRDSLRLKK